MRALWVSLGAIAGANARYWGSIWLTDRLGALIPWATLLINVSGSLVLGALLGVVVRRPGVYQAWVLLIGTGFCGSYTTFSTFSVELFEQAQSRSIGALLAYAALSLGLGLGAASAGWLLATAVLAD